MLIFKWTSRIHLKIIGGLTNCSDVMISVDYFGQMHPVLLWLQTRTGYIIYSIIHIILILWHSWKMLVVLKLSFQMGLIYNLENNFVKCVQSSFISNLLTFLCFKVWTCIWLLIDFSFIYHIYLFFCTLKRPCTSVSDYHKDLKAWISLFFFYQNELGSETHALKRYWTFHSWIG